MNRRNFIISTSAAALSACASRGTSMSNSEVSISKRRVLWAANVRTKSLDERLAAAKASAFDVMSVFPIDYKGWIDGGLTGTKIRRKFEAAGVGAAIVDPFVQWTPDFEIPSYYPAENVAFINHSEEEVFEMAAVLRSSQINVVEGLGKKHERSALVDSLGGFADRARSRGLKVGLEPMPISSIATLAQGWDLVSAIDLNNLGLTFDTWHFWRADPDHTVLSSIPPEKIFDVQLADAKTELKGTLIEDLLGHRLFPGQGDFDLETTILVLQKMGAFNSVGHELFSNAMDALPASEVAALSAAKLNQYF